MSKQSLIALAALAGILGAIPTAADPISPASLEQVLKEKDQTKLGEVLRKWIESVNERKGTSDARAKVQDELESWRKKREVGERDPLSLTDDLGRALWYANDYEGAKGTRKGKVADVEVQTAGTADAPSRTIEYAIHAPAKYRAAEGPYPLIVCIPDAGEKASAHLTEKWILAEILDHAILAAVPMPADAAAYTGDEARTNFFAVFGDVTRTYAVDFDRIYVAGRGKGVETAMWLGSQFPDRFAGIIGRTGDAGAVRPENFHNLPTFFAGAGAQASAFAEACKAAEHDNATLVPDGKEEQVWAWIQDHTRKANPPEVVLLPGAPFPNRAYWVQIPGFDNTDGKALIRATINRAENKINIEAKGVSEVTLFFNDILIDLDRPVKVVCNGAEHENQLQRSLTDFLKGVETTRNDPGKLYTASKKYDVLSGG